MNIVEFVLPEDVSIYFSTCSKLNRQGTALCHSVFAYLTGTAVHVGGCFRACVRLLDGVVVLVLPSFSGRILVLDTAVAQRCASLHVPNPRSDREALIAATALVHGMTVVTRK